MLISEHVMKYHFADISLNKSLSRSFMKINIIHDFRDSVPVHFFFFFFFCLGFLSRTFTIHRTGGEGVGYLFNSSLPLPTASQTLKTLAGRLLQRAHLYT